MQCEKCGKQLMDDATLCTSCGWKTKNWQHKVKRGKEMHAGLIAATVLFLGLLVFLAVIFL